MVKEESVFESLYLAGTLHLERRWSSLSARHTLRHTPPVPLISRGPFSWQGRLFTMSRRSSSGEKRRLPPFYSPLPLAGLARPLSSTSSMSGCQFHNPTPSSFNKSSLEAPRKHPSPFLYLP